MDIQILKQYETVESFKSPVGGKHDNVFLAIGNKIFPKGDKGYSGIFYKDKNVPYFVRIQNNKTIATFNLQHYVPFDEYNEPIIFG